jgi:uncharacterized membrane protein YbaN (DUF454 family)
VIHDRTALGLFLLTLLVGLVLGGTGSASVRMLIQGGLISSGAFLMFSMLARGRWRFVTSPLWIFPLLVVAWGMVQCFVPSRGLMKPAGWNIEASYLTWNRFATIQSTLWVAALFSAGLVAAHSLRSVGRIKGLAGVFILAVLATGCFGVFQSLLNDTKFLGLYSATDPRISPSARDWMGSTSTLGMQRVTPFQVFSGEPGSSKSSAPKFVWFGPTIRTAQFGSFLDATEWASVAGTIMPMALAAGVFYLRRRSSNPTSPWDLDAPLGWAFLTAAGLLSLGSILGNLLSACVSTVIGVLVLIQLSAPSDRRLVCWHGLVPLAFLAVGVLAAFAIMGTSTIETQIRHWLADSASLLAMCWDHFWTGCGMGSPADLWPMYRTDDRTQAGSSLLAMMSEVGMPIIAVGALFFMLALFRWFHRAPNLPDETRLVIAGVAAGLCSWLAWGALGPGADHPLALLVVAVLSGCLIRGLATREPLREGAQR